MPRLALRSCATATIQASSPTPGEKYSGNVPASLTPEAARSSRAWAGSKPQERHGETPPLEAEPGTRGGTMPAAGTVAPAKSVEVIRRRSMASDRARRNRAPSAGAGGARTTR